MDASGVRGEPAVFDRGPNRYEPVHVDVTTKWCAARWSILAHSVIACGPCGPDCPSGAGPARRANHFELSEIMSRPFAKNISLPFFGKTWLSRSRPAPD